MLIPPPADILEGVTLQIVRFGRPGGYSRAARCPLPLSGRDGWDEAFLTSTSRHVVPLVRLDGVPIGNGTPGPLTGELHRRFEGYFAGIDGPSDTCP